MGMENEVKHFLVTIVQTVSLVILWMLINVIVGIRMRIGLFDDRPSVTNIIYYVLSLISLVFLIKYFIRKWRDVKKF